MGRKTIRRGLGKRHISGKDFRLAEEIRYIQRRAAEHVGHLDGDAFVYVDRDTARVVTILGYPVDRIRELG